MKFQRLVEISATIAGRSARLAKVETLESWLRELLGELNRGALQKDQVAAAISILAGRLPFGKLGVGWARIRDSLPAEATRDDDSPALDLTLVLASFRDIQATTGKGSTARKVEQLTHMFEAASPIERNFLVRLLMQDLRQGALEGLMIDAVARAAEVPITNLRRAAMLAGSAVEASIVALTEGEGGLAAFRIDLFRPLQPMLAQPAETIEQALQIMEDVSRARQGNPQIAIEAKIDGARVQVHRDGDHVEVFSRRLRNVTASVPEVVEAALALDAENVILDGEAFAVRPDGSAHPFQVTMRRFGRSQSVEKHRTDQPLAVIWFDCLYCDGEELIDQPSQSRRQTLEKICSDPASKKALVPLTELRYSLDPSQESQATREQTRNRAFQALGQLLDQGHEGIMVKDMDSFYAAGKRGKAWLKVKPTYTLDLVVLAAEWGHGRRKGWLSNLHLGARDDSAEGGFVMLGKTFKGLTDKLLEWQTEQLLSLETSRSGITVHVKPELVVEIAFNDVQDSPQYPGGVALRFARVKAYRDDKSPEQADTLETVKKIHAANDERT